MPHGVSECLAEAQWACRWPVKALVVGGGYCPREPRGCDRRTATGFCKTELVGLYLACIAAAGDRDLRKVHTKDSSIHITPCDGKNWHNKSHANSITRLLTWHFSPFMMLRCRPLTWQRVPYSSSLFSFDHGIVDRGALRITGVYTSKNCLHPHLILLQYSAPPPD